MLLGEDWSNKNTWISCYYFIYKGRNWEKSKGLFLFQVLEDLTQTDLSLKSILLYVWLQGTSWCKGSNVIRPSVLSYSFLSDGSIQTGFPFMIQISLKPHGLSLSSPTGKIKIFFLGYSIRVSLLSLVLIGAGKHSCPVC